MNYLPAYTNFIESARTVRLAHLVALEVPGGSFVYLTDYMRDITFDGITYAAGVIKPNGIGKAKQTRKFNNFTVTLKLSGVDEVELARSLASAAYLNLALEISRAYLDDNGDVIPAFVDGSLVRYFAGKITSSSIKDSFKVDGAGTSVLTWTCNSEFADFKKVNGRITDDTSHRGLVFQQGFTELQPSTAAKRDAYQSDLGFFHANKSVSVLATYQALETRFKTNVKKTWYGSIKSIKTTEYQVTVTREVDLRYELTAKYIPVVYGTRKVTGIPVFVDTLVNDPNTVYVVYTFCEGEIEGFLDMYIGDDPAVCWDATYDSETRVCYGSKKTTGNTINIGAPNGSGVTDHGTTYIVNDGDGDIEFTVYHGAPAQTASTILTEIAEDGNFYLQQNPVGGGLPIGDEYWGVEHRLLDTAYVVAKFSLSQDRLDIPEISADISGRIISEYDSTGNEVVTGTTSLNPAWQIADFARSERFGGGVALDRIDTVAIYDVSRLFNIVDTSYEMSWVAYWRYVGWNNFDGTTENRHIMQCNTQLNTETTVFKNISAMLDQVEASFAISSGVFRLSAVADKAVVQDFTIGDVIDGDLSISDTSISTRYNSVQASIADPGLQWSTNSITFYDSEYKDLDNNVENKGSFSFPFITNYYTARACAERFLKASRSTRTLIFTLSFKGNGLQVNDHITFTADRYNWDKKRWIVMDLEQEANTAHIKVTATEYIDGMFINSAQVDITDSQIPDISNNVLPVSDLAFTPYVVPATGAIAGKNGDLTWNPSISSDVAYYLVTWNGLARNVVVPVDPTAAITEQITYSVSELDPGNYTFSVKAVTSMGKSSLASLETATLGQALVLALVEDFQVINASTTTPGSWNGGDVSLTWSEYEGPTAVTGLAYNLVIETNTVPRVVVRDVSLTALQYIYTQAMNEADFTAEHLVAGVNRQLNIKIRATADNSAVSADWSEI